MITDIFPKSAAVKTIDSGDHAPFELVTFYCHQGGRLNLLLTLNDADDCDQFAAAFTEAVTRIRVRKSAQQAAE